MNRFESDQWAKVAKQQAMQSLKENGSGLSQSINTVLKNCSLSAKAKQELNDCLRREEEKVSRYLKESGLI
jgi:hypothetical protein